MAINLDSIFGPKGKTLTFKIWKFVCRTTAINPFFSMLSHTVGFCEKSLLYGFMWVGKSKLPSPTDRVNKFCFVFLCLWHLNCILNVLLLSGWLGYSNDKCSWSKVHCNSWDKSKKRRIKTISVRIHLTRNPNLGVTFIEMQKFKLDWE